MSFYRSLLTNHPLVNVLFVVVLVMGLYSYSLMPREQDPEINFNWVIIQVTMPGASAADIEDLVTAPIEDSLRQVQDVRMVTSSSREGRANLLVRFHQLSDREFDKRLADLRREVQNKANDELPDDADDPDIRTITTSNGFPTVLVVVRGTANDEALRREARFVRDAIERIEGVDKVDALGLSEPELIVEIDPQRLARYNISATDIADDLNRAFRNTFAGSTSVAGEEWLIRVSNTSDEPERLAAFPIASRADPTLKVPLGELARVYRATEEPFQLISSDGRPAISLSVSKVAFTNTIKLVDRIRDFVAERNALVGDDGFDIIIADDQTIPTRNALRTMQTNALLGMALVLGVTWLFLGFKIALMVTLGLVFSIAGTFWLLAATGNTLNVAVLLGIVIVLGMLVDDAVVVVEAIFYRLQRGYDAVTASLDALSEVGRPVTAAVSTTIAAFMPLMLMPGIVGQFLSVVPFVVSVGLAISLVEAFWILPAHIVAFERPGAGGQPTGQVRKTLRNRMTQKIRLRYTRMLIYVMRRPLRFLALGVVSFVLAIGSAGQLRFDFFAGDPLRIFYVSVTMSPGAKLEDTLAAAQRIERRIAPAVRDDERRAISVLAGVQFNEVEMLVGDQYAQIQVSLLPKTTSNRSVAEIIDVIRDDVLATPVNGEVSFLAITGGPPTERPINVKMRGDDLTQLRDATDAMLTRIRAVPGTTDVIDDEVPGRRELVLDLDERAVRDAGLDPGTVSRLVRLHMDGEIVSFIRSSGEKLELRIRGPQRELSSVDAVLDDPVVLPDGSVRALRTLVRTDTTRGRSEIRHYDFQRTITILGDIDAAVTDIVAINRDIGQIWAEIKNQFPAVDIEQAGPLDDIQESVDALGGLFILGIGLIYLILATQFRSYFQPFLILLTIPMAFTGVVFINLLTGYPVSLWTLYGTVALTGIAVNAALVMIDAANQRIAAGMRPLHATVYAARRRVIPILMTTATTIAGLFSLAVGLGGKSLVWGPVASSIVAGLLVASTLTLFMVPVLYRLVMRRSHRPLSVDGKDPALAH
ncbi:MAG: efflux RND transporter permease subunit [Pseudomonadota bacterium]